MVMIVCKLGWAGQSKAGRGWLAGCPTEQGWATLVGWAKLGEAGQLGWLPGWLAGWQIGSLR